MGALSIVTIGPELLAFKDIVLRQRAVEVPVQDAKFLKICQKLALEMFEVMYMTGGVGLAAPQVGISLRLVVMDPEDSDLGPHTLINPVIEFKSEVEEARNEACLSIPRYAGTVSRSTEVHVRAYNLKGELEEYHATGRLARVFQHEIDHLDGVLYPDRLRPGDDFVEIELAVRYRAAIAVKKSLE
jgi:peptide deformylase